MNISEIHVDDFGAWHDLTLGDLGKGATVFYGPNEAGKTTLLNLIRTVLYGFSEKRCGRYLPPAQGTEAGGSLTISDINGRYTLQRLAPARYRGGDGTLRIDSERGDKLGNELLTTLLAGVDETIFNNVFAVGLTQMQQLATLSDTEAANQLYGLATGVDRVSLFDVTRQLESQRDILLAGNSAESTNDGVLDQLLDQKSRLQKELKSLRRDEGHFAKLRREHRALQREIKDKEHAKRILDGKGDWSELSATIRKRWKRCKQINDRLASIGPIVDIPKHIQTRVTAIYDQIKQRRREWESLRDERKRIKSKASKLKGSDALYPYAAEIEALDRQRTRILALEEDVARCKSTVAELEFEMQAEMEELGLQTGTSAKQLPPISDQVIDALREPARETRELRESVDELKKIAEERRKQAERVKGELETAAVRFGGKDISAVLNQGVSLVQGLERRIDLGEHREGLVRRLDEVQDEVRYWQRRGVMPWRGVMAICGVFSTGAMLLLTGVFNDWFSLTDSTRLPMMLIGGSLSVVSLVIKGAFEHSARDRAESCLEQIDLLNDEQDRAVKEVEELDRTIPPGNGPLDQRLIDARNEMSELDQYLPLNQQYQALIREADAADHQATLAVRQLKDARRGWKASLRTVGLPDSLTPSQVGQMTSRVSDVTRIRNRANQAKREMQDRQQELSTIRHRIEQLLIVAEIHNAPDSLGPQLTRLLAELEKHSKSGKERQELRLRWEELGKKQKRIAATAQRQYANRRQLLEAHGISSAREFRDTLRRGEKATVLRRERNSLLETISQFAGDEFPAKRLQKLLDKRSNALMEYISRIDRDRKTIGEDLAGLCERARQLKQKLDGQINDRRGERKELEIRILDEKIREAGKRWHRAALVSTALDRVKKNYETKRQPVALAEASQHLERLTEGRYTRIWTPMAQNSLCVDDRFGTALPVEKLSRGTRELVFLSLRLALVSSYNRRGANMPLVLDDVFVNFDDQRARAATSVLADISKSGQQMLIFTCHERIRNIFTELQADVRDLPIRGGLARTATPVTLPADPEPQREPETQSPPITEFNDVETELPVYDADSWDETIEQLALDLPTAPPNAQIADKFVEPPPVAKKASSDRPHHGRNAWQVEPAWRDEWLEPLPDLAADDDTIFERIALSSPRLDSTKGE